MPQLSLFLNSYPEVYFLRECEYTEIEWKNMISLRYINTSYSTKAVVNRLHVFSKAQFRDELYEDSEECTQKKPTEEGHILHHVVQIIGHTKDKKYLLMMHIFYIHSMRKYT